ncbi:MAG: hypothetical protein HC822_11180, partial [Oscillochloris sp.]|nr:hypothetical protein [Oscillochloris sp.]
FVPRRGSLPEYALGTPDPFYDIQAPHFRRLLHDLAAAGWEVGLHASYRAYERPDGIAAERALLEAAAGTTVIGNRHHYYHMHPGNPEATLLAHERAGLLYDSSLTHDRYLGWRRGSSWPYLPFHHGERRALRTLQLPTGWMDAHVFLRCAENPGERDALLRDLADRAIDQGGLMLIDIHDYVYDDALFPDWRATYSRLFSYLGARGDVWLARPCDIATHWINRQAAIERASEGLS